MDNTQNFAVFRVQSRQFQASPGDTLVLNRLTARPGDQITVEDVLLLTRPDGASMVGTPKLAGARVMLRVLQHIQGPKLRIFKKKRRTGYTKRQGHRQKLTVVKVENIEVQTGSHGT